MDEKYCLRVREGKLILSFLFLKLSPKEQSQILNSYSANTGKSAIILEKDIWIVWALNHLFQMPDKLNMAFKGGTSLSKVFNAIHRFSEDVDITIDYKSFTTEDPLVENFSRTKITKISENIKNNLRNYLQDTILPYFEACIKSEFEELPPRLELDKDGETLQLYYPSSLEEKSQYIQDSIRLEFGGRNKAFPNMPTIIKSDISEYVPDLEFPEATINVLSPEKTFWEKITLIHVECNRPSLKVDANRISRHWYDVIMMMKNEIGQNAINNIAVLAEVIEVKKIFFNSSYANYDDCLIGNIRLIPDTNQLKQLESDFQKMLDEKMFYREAPTFETIIEQLTELERDLKQKLGGILRFVSPSTTLK